jgi:hypothetical protein
MKSFRVYPNPWSAHDKDGIPCGMCPRDPDADAGGPGAYVGATVDSARTEVLQKLEKGDDIRSARQKTVYLYMGVTSSDPELASKLLALEPIDLPSTKYYRDRVAEGSLLCADKTSAETARFKFFVPPAQVLSRFISAKAEEPAAEPNQSTGSPETPPSSQEPKTPPAAASKKSPKN